MNSHSGLPYIYTIYMKVLFDVLFAMLLLRAYAVSGKLTTLGKVRYRKLTQQTLSRIERQNKLVTFFFFFCLLSGTLTRFSYFRNALLFFTVFRNKYGQTVTVGVSGAVNFSPISFISGSMSRPSDQTRTLRSNTLPAYLKPKQLRVRG